MHRFRRALAATLGIVALCAVPITASAQNGWAWFTTTLSGPGGGIYRTFVQGSNGLEETFTEEFTPGTHTMARVEARYNNCTASADNVTFTITAGKWTEVDVPFAWKSCSMPIRMLALGIEGDDGVGTVRYVTAPNIGPAQTIATCTITHVAGPQFYAWTNFHACQGDAPYGDSIYATLTPAVGSTAPDSEFAIAADTNAINYDFGGGSFSQFPHPFPNGVSAKADLSITLVGGSAQGFVSSSVFRIVNHGPNNAYGVTVVSTFAGPDHGGEIASLMSIQDGYCDQEFRCGLTMLPAGDSDGYSAHGDRSGSDRRSFG